MIQVRMLPTALALAALVPVGCESMSNTGKGVVGGSLLGSAVGTGIGLATGNPRAGAAIGGLGGAAVGGMVGADKDEKQRERSDAIALAQAESAAPISRGPLSVAEVMQMSRPDPATNARVSDDLIINYIQTTNSQYNLTPQDLRELTAAGVSDRVIQEMMATRQRVQPPRRTVVVREAAPPPVVVYERPYYDPWGGPGYYRPYRPYPAPGFGFSYSRYR